MSFLTTKARRTAAALATGALLGATLVAMAPAATAAPLTATGASANWGVKSSWRNYIGEETGRDPSGPSARSSIVVSEGATFDGTQNSNKTPVVNEAPYIWSAGAASTFDPSTGAANVALGGKVTYSFPDHDIRSFAFSNPRVSLNGNGGGSLFVDIAYDTGGAGGGQPPKNESATGVQFATLSGVGAPVQTSVTGGTRLTYPSITTTLTAAGATAVNGFWFAGVALDPITLRFTVDADMSQTKATVSPSKVAYGTAASVRVAVAGSATGNVTLLDGTKSLGTKSLSSGAATFTLPKTLRIGAHTLTAKFSGVGRVLPSQGVAKLTVVKAKANATAKFTKTQAKKAKAGKRAKLTVKVTARGVTPTGKVVVKDGKKKVETAKLKKGKASIKLPKLKKGKHKFTVTYNGSGTVAKDGSKKLRVTVKR